jgi:hypothetical protein
MLYFLKIRKRKGKESIKEREENKKGTGKEGKEKGKERPPN